MIVVKQRGRGMKIRCVTDKRNESHDDDLCLATGITV